MNNFVSKQCSGHREVTAPTRSNGSPSKFTSTLICYPAVTSKEVQGTIQQMI